MKHNFKNLKIWNLAMDIALDVHKVTLEFPKHELYGLSNQLNRASVSMASNIAEGSNRGNRYFLHYLNISLGSSFEVQTQILIAQQNNYIDNNQAKTIEDKLDEFQKMMTGFINKLEKTNQV
jgi:four helix bundle protein